MKKRFFSIFHMNKNRIKNNFVSLLSNFSSKILIQILFPPLMIMFWELKILEFGFLLPLFPLLFQYLT